MDNGLSDLLFSSVQTPGYASAPSPLLFEQQWDDQEREGELLRFECYIGLTTIFHRHLKPDTIKHKQDMIRQRWKGEEKQHDTLTRHPNGRRQLRCSWPPSSKRLLRLLCTSEAEWSPNRQKKTWSQKSAIQTEEQIFKQHIIYTGSI